MTDDAFDAWRQRARDADILDVALGAAVNAKLRAGKRERVGPCPRCGGKDRFSVNTAKQVFNCRGAAGGDVVAMVMHARAVEFLAACEIIVGEPPPAKGTQLTPEAKAAAAAALEESKKRAARRDADENAYRAAERERTFAMWSGAHPLEGSTAADYLARRGLVVPPAGRDKLRCIESLPYVVQRPNSDRGERVFEVLHRGPAMVAQIIDSSRKFRGLHITWLDLAQPKGKLKLEDPKTGEALEAKKARGSKKGNVVELVGVPNPERLVLGEGIEKTLAVWRAMATQAADGRAELANTDQPIMERTAFWSACDLGNLAGEATDSVKHPTLTHEKSGRPIGVAGGVPDLEAPAIAVPDSVVDLVLLGDSTSDEFTTRLAMCRAAARYVRPGRSVRVAWAPPGLDFDDLWREAGTEAERAAAAARILAIVDAAAPPVMPAIAPAAGPGALRRKGKRSADLSAPAAGAPARDSAPTGAAAVGPQQTDAGNAGVPTGLPAADTGPDTVGPPALAALGPLPPPAAAPPGASSAEQSAESSREGRPGARSANRARWGGPPNKYGEGREALDRWLAFFPMTELGLIERYVQREKHRLCYCDALGWLWWDGRKWSREGGEAKAIAAGHDTVRAIQDEAAAIAGTEFDEIVSIKKVKTGKGKDATEEEVAIYLSDLLPRFGRESETKAAMTLHKHALAYLSHIVERFDANHMLLNIANGTLVFSRAPFARDEPLPLGWKRHNDHIRLKPHDPADLITKLAPVSYRAGATCPLYDASMLLWQPDKNYRDFLDVWDGYSMTADAGEQKLVLGIGTGKNGKSTWTQVKLRLLGDYGGSVPISTLMDAGKARAAGQASPDLAMLRGLRMLLTSEPPKHWKVDEGLVKDLTGGDKVTVRGLYAGYFQLDPRFKLTVAGNHKPEFTAGDRESGMWRRVILVDWKVTIPEEMRDVRLVDKLLDEGSGILNRWLGGLTQWLEHGLRVPKEIAAATEEFRAERDVLGRFLAECTEAHHANRAGVTQTHELFVAWSKASGESGRHEWTPKGFGQAMKERGFVSVKISIMMWVGIRLIKNVSDFVDHEGRPIAGAAPDKTDDASARPPPSRRRDDGEDEPEGF